MKSRIKRRYKKNLRLNDVVRTQRDIILLRAAMYPILEIMGVSNNIVNFPVRFGEEWEFKKDSDAFYTKKEIVIKRGNKVLKVLGDLAHEYGHEVTVTGGYGTESNLLGETTAYNFQKTFLYNFNNYVGTHLEMKATKSFLERLSNNWLYTLAATLSFIPLGRWIKSKYKRTHESRAHKSTSPQ